MTEILNRTATALAVSSLLGIAGWNILKLQDQQSSNAVDLDPEKDVELIQTECIQKDQTAVHLLRRLRLFRQGDGDGNYLMIIDEMDKLLNMVRKIQKGEMEPTNDDRRFGVECQHHVNVALDNLCQQLPHVAEAHFEFNNVQYAIKDYVGNQTNFIANRVYIQSL